MTRLTSSSFIGAAFAAAMMALPVSAATFTSCNDAGLSVDVSDALLANVGCDVISDTGKVNAGALDGFLGADDWKKRGALKRSEMPGMSKALRAAKDGTWSVRKRILNTFDNVLIVFEAKKGASAAPGKFVAFQVNEANGTFSSPFFESDLATTRNIKRISLFVSNDPVDPGEQGTEQPVLSSVPLPAGGLLLLSGLLGLGLIRRRG